MLYLNNLVKELNNINLASDKYRKILKDIEPFSDPKLKLDTIKNASVINGFEEIYTKYTNVKTLYNNYTNKLSYKPPSNSPSKPSFLSRFTRKKVSPDNYGQTLN